MVNGNNQIVGQRLWGHTCVHNRCRFCEKFYSINKHSSQLSLHPPPKFFKKETSKVCFKKINFFEILLHLRKRLVFIDFNDFSNLIIRFTWITTSIFHALNVSFTPIRLNFTTSFDTLHIWITFVWIVSCITFVSIMRWVGFCGK